VIYGALFNAEVGQMQTAADSQVGTGGTTSVSGSSRCRQRLIHRRAQCEPRYRLILGFSSGVAAVVDRPTVTGELARLTVNTCSNYRRGISRRNKLAVVKMLNQHCQQGLCDVLIHNRGVPMACRL